jgi:uncharacterized protein involved in outer membrane biogenesis
MISFSLSISKSFSTFLTKIDQTRPFTVSHQNGFAPSEKLQPSALKLSDQVFLSNSFPSKNFPFSLNLTQSRLSLLLANVDRTDPLTISRQNGQTDLNNFSLMAFSRTPTQTTAEDPMASEGSEARFGRTFVSVGGLLALIVAVALVIVIHRNRMRSEIVEEEKEATGAEIDIVEMIASFEASDRYVSQVGTGELIRLSFVIE